MNLSKSQAIIFVGIAAFVIFLALAILGIIPIFNSSTTTPPVKGQLTIWGIDNQEAFRDAIDSYASLYKDLHIAYKQIDPNNYENILVDALASHSGPDIFMFHRSWLQKHGNKVVPLDSTQFPILKLRQLYPDIVEKDFVSNGKIYALPLYLDSLALFYNKDIFNNKGIAVTPTTWDDFKLLVPFLTTYDTAHQIQKSAAAIGGSDKSITVAPDILSLLMLQSGSGIAKTSSYGNGINFDQQAGSGFNFYLQFSNPTNNYYTWSDSLNNYLDAFGAGNTAMIFGYARDINNIKSKSPFLNFDIIPAPQFNPNQPVNYADYWGLAVSNQSPYPQYAWDFINYMTTDPQNISSYLKATNLPPAIRTMVAQYQSDPVLNAFAKQSLTAQAVPQQDIFAYNQAISNMIEYVLSGKLTVDGALREAQAELNH